MGGQTSPAAGSLSPAALQILLSLADTPRHGYGIKMDIEARTDGAVRLGSGSLYETIQRLESLAFINESDPPAAEQDNRRRRYYALTPAGRRALKDELLRLDRVLAYARDRKLLPDA